MSLLDTVEGMLGGQGGAGGPASADGLAQQISAGDQNKSVLGDEHIAAVANRLGISPDDASAKIAEFLPVVIRRPAEELPREGSLTALLAIQPNATIGSG